MKREQLIIVADDYGIREASAPILALAQSGKLDRVAVMTRYASAEQAVALARTGVKLDVHLELIELLRMGESGHGGAISRGLNFLWRFVSGAASAARAEAAWREQIETFRTLFGRLPDGLDSHEHVHFFPRYFRVYLKLAREYQIPYVRFSERGMIERRRPVAWILQTLWGWCGAAWRSRSADDCPRVTSDYLVSYDWIEDFGQFLERLPEGTIEIVFHPEKDAERVAVEKYL